MKATTKKRIKTTVFWSGIASSLIIFAQSIATLFGYELPADTMAQIMAAVNSLLALLTFSGVLVDSKEVDSFQTFSAKVKSFKKSA
jgi:phi LC3 family holin